MLPILDPVEQLQKLPIFLIPLVGIPGKTPHQRYDQKGVRNGGQHQFHSRAGDKYRQQAGSHAHTQKIHIQLVVAVATHHKPGQPHFDFVHTDAHLLFDSYIILHFFQISTVKTHCLRIVFYFSQNGSGKFEKMR